MSGAAEDRRWMHLALGLGRRGLGVVWPNPAVGCVLVRDGRVVGRGWTQPGGRPHAEVVALGQARDAARGADAYVTLEPCAHHGQTGPCAEALVAAGVQRVVIAVGDPDARVRGKGIDILRAAGITVEVGVLEAEASRDHAGFFRRISAGRPMVTLKLASSIDGRIATGSGDSQWITGPLARRVVHEMRASHDAVLIGAGTARADLPSLTVRDLGDRPNPVRIVVSAGLDLPRHGPLVDTARETPVWLMHGAGADEERLGFWRNAGARCFEIEAENSGRVQLPAVLERCAREGLTRVFCEGGGQLASGLLKAGCVDVLEQFVGGMAIGGDGLPSLGDLGAGMLSQAPRFELARSCQLGGDVRLTWTRS